MLAANYTDNPVLAGVREKVETMDRLGISKFERSIYWKSYGWQALMLRRRFVRLCGIRRLSSRRCILTLLIVFDDFSDC
jgi:hypothetical protein